MLLLKRKTVVLLILSVALLFVVSARMNQAVAEKDHMLNALDLPVAENSPEPLSPKQDATEEALDLPPVIDLDSWQYKLVNSAYVLSSSFAPNVTEIGNQQYFDSRAVEALNAMMQGAADAGYGCFVRTAYRPYSTQAYLFYGKASQLSWDGSVSYEKAEILARNYVAYPGCSEHQLGLAADLMPDADTAMVAEDVADLPLLLWLKEHCKEYGFILRYPAEKKEITGWNEPWHFRYVGEEAACYIMEHELCLEEFLELY